jgi:hypothetical protein
MNLEEEKHMNIWKRKKKRERDRTERNEARNKCKGKVRIKKNENEFSVNSISSKLLHCTRKSSSHTH